MNILDNVTAPFVGQKYCMFYYILTVASAFILFLVIVGVIVAIFKNFKKLKGIQYFQMFTVIVNWLVIYFINRLMYTVCMRALA